MLFESLVSLFVSWLPQTSILKALKVKFCIEADVTVWYSRTGKHGTNEVNDLTWIALDELLVAARVVDICGLYLYQNLMPLLF